MQISKHKVVTMDYVLRDDQGSLIDSSEGKEPLAYIQGAGSIIPGLENALEGKTNGDSLAVRIAPEEAYGERDETLLQVVPRNMFDVPDVDVGMQFQTQSEAGPQIVTVVAMTDDEITVDANHPLAGVTLNFEVNVVDVRDASDDELSHGHVHGPGGHHH